MRCEQCLEQLSPYLDDMLSDAEKKQLESHLEQCESCREELSVLQMLKAEMGKIEEVELPEGLHQSMMNKVYDTPQQSNGQTIGRVKIPRNIYKYVSGLAAAMLLITVGLRTGDLFNVPVEEGPSIMNEQAEFAADETRVAIESTQDEVASNQDIPEDMPGLEPVPMRDEEMDEAELSIGSVMGDADQVSDMLKWYVTTDDKEAVISFIESSKVEYNFKISEVDTSDRVIYNLTEIEDMERLKEGLVAFGVVTESGQYESGVQEVSIEIVE